MKGAYRVVRQGEKARCVICGRCMHEHRAVVHRAMGGSHAGSQRQRGGRVVGDLAGHGGILQCWEGLRAEW